MQKPITGKPTRSKFTLLRQLCNLIPTHLVNSLAREHGAEERSRTFKPWSHVVSLLFAQLTHALGLNDVCDALRLHSGPLSAIRGATPPSKNGLSHTNRERDPAMAEALFRRMLEHLQQLAPRFGGARRPRFAFRFKRMIHVVDSTTIQRVARCRDWAKHRRPKAAAGCCYDIAFAASTFASLKHEILPDHQPFASFAHARLAVFDYLETFYNRRRLDSALGYRTPLAILDSHFPKPQPSLT